MLGSSHRTSINTMDIGIPELLIVLVIVLLLFGPGRISKTAGELGKGIRAFRDGITGKDEPKPEPPADQQPEKPADDSQPR
jgi:sec-independent protein translocase protein TatA